MTTGEDPRVRTVEVAVAEVRYGSEFARLNERFWQRLDTILNFAQVMAGALALAGAFSGGEVLAVAGLVMAVVSGLQIALQPGRRAAEFKVARLAWQRLARDVWKIELTDLDSRLEDLRAESPQGLDVLSGPAFNAVQQRHGNDARVALSWRERLASALA